MRVPDPRLRAVLEDSLGLSEGAPIRAVELARLTVLEAPDASIFALTGLEFAIGLTSLNLEHSRIPEVAPLAGLTSLTSLNLVSNNISEVTPLAGLTNLTYLNLGDNNISEVAALTGLTNLTNLTKLNLLGNALTEVAPLAGLTNLTYLNLWRNRLTEVAPLSGLTNLTYLNLGDNNISEVTPLAGLTSLISLRLEHNWVVEVAPLAGLTSLISLYIDRDVDVSSLSGLTGLTVHFMLPPYRYPQLGSLSDLVEAYEDALAAGRVTSAVVPVSGGCPWTILPGAFLTWDPSKPAPSIYVDIGIYTIESVDVVVRFLADHGISIPPRRIWKDEDAYPPGLIGACVPVPLLVPLSELPGVSSRIRKVYPPVLLAPAVIEEESWGAIKNRFK